MELQHELLSRSPTSRHSRGPSFDSSSVKEVDPAAHFQQVRSAFGSKRSFSGDSQILDDGSEIQELLKAGRDELLKTSVLFLKHLSGENIISLMQLIVESGNSESNSYTKLYKPSGYRLFNKIVSKFKAFVSGSFLAVPTSQLYKVFIMTSCSIPDAVEMSDAVAAVLAGNYLPDLEFLALPPCNASTIAMAIVDGHVSTLKHLELQGPLDQLQYPKRKAMRRLFLSGLLVNLQHLKLSRCVEVEEIEAMAMAGDGWKLPSLTHLDLSFNLLRGETGSKCLAKLMTCRAFLNLEHLNLHHCGISDAGMQALASEMQQRGPWKLRYLNLGSNEIGDDGFAALLRVIKADRFPYLQELDFLYNYKIGDDSKVVAARALEEGHLPALQVVYISSHSITERVAEAFLSAYKNNTALTVDLLGILWPNESMEREAADYRERNVGLLAGGGRGE